MLEHSYFPRPNYKGLGVNILASWHCMTLWRGIEAAWGTAGAQQSTSLSIRSEYGTAAFNKNTKREEGEEKQEKERKGGLESVYTALGVD